MSRAVRSRWGRRELASASRTRTRARRRARARVMLPPAEASNDASDDVRRRARVSAVGRARASPSTKAARRRRSSRRSARRRRTSARRARAQCGARAAGSAESRLGATSAGRRSTQVDDRLHPPGNGRSRTRGRAPVAAADDRRRSRLRRWAMPRRPNTRHLGGLAARVCRAVAPLRATRRARPTLLGEGEATRHMIASVARSCEAARARRRSPVATHAPAAGGVARARARARSAAADAAGGLSDRQRRRGDERFGRRRRRDRPLGDARRTSAGRRAATSDVSLSPPTASVAGARARAPATVAAAPAASLPPRSRSRRPAVGRQEALAAGQPGVLALEGVTHAAGAAVGGARRPWLDPPPRASDAPAPLLSGVTTSRRLLGCPPPDASTTSVARALGAIAPAPLDARRARARAAGRAADGAVVETLPVRVLVGHQPRHQPRHVPRVGAPTRRARGRARAEDGGVGARAPSRCRRRSLRPPISRPSPRARATARRATSTSGAAAGIPSDARRPHVAVVGAFASAVIVASAPLDASEHHLRRRP